MAKSWLCALVSVTGARIREDLWLYLCVAGYCAIGLVMLIACGHLELMAYGLYFGQWTYLFLFFMPLTAILVDSTWIVVRFNERRSLALRRALSPHRLSHMLAGMLLLMALMIFQGTFTSIKNLLPLLRGGFLYDRPLADFDAWLSFGTDPWRLLYASLDNRILFGIVDWNYGVLWFSLCFGALFYVATSPRAAKVRVRYVSMFMLVWVLCGNVLAGLFISAGPVFYGYVTGNEERFGDQLKLLSSDGWTSKAAVFQRYLWSLHESGTAGLGSGISAFPSVHVGLIALIAFFAVEVSRRLGIAAFGYLAFVMASSVYLGWHYAIDGYASVLVVAAMHYGLKRLMCPAQRGADEMPLQGAAASA